MSEELITVIIPTYNRFKYLLRSINSVLIQTWKNVEIIVIDDCSTQQQYLDLSKIYENEHRVKIIQLEKNSREVYNSKSAQGMTRNEGIKIAKGEWIAFLDDDDFYIMKDKLERQINIMKKYNIKGSCSNMVTGKGLDPDSYHNIYFNFPVGIPLEDKISIIDEKILLDTNYINNSSTLIHRSIIEKAGLQKLVIYEDYEYWKECIKYTNFIYLSDCTTGYDSEHGGGIYYSIY